MESSSASVSVVPGANEDSVDIYDGLDVGICSKGEKSSPANAGLKDSLDLYEDIVAEEQLSRESSYTELKLKFQAAQNQIREFHQRLEQMEKQNTGLSKENHCLKKNISALLRTARQEVMRKDATIQKLTKWAESGRHSHQPTINNHKALNSSSRSSTVSSIGGSTPLRASSPLPPSAHSQSREDHPSGDQSQPSRTESRTLSRPSETSPHRHYKRDAEVAGKQTKLDKPYQSQKLSKSTDGRHKDCSCSNRDPHTLEEKRSHREDKDRRKCDYRSCKNRKHPSVQEDCQVVKSSSKENVLNPASSSEHNKQGSTERRADKVKRVHSGYDSLYGSRDGCSSEYRKNKHGHKHDKPSDMKDRKHSSSHQQTERHGSSLKEREGSRKKDYQRKSYKEHEDEVTRRPPRRSSHPETSRDCDKQRPKEFNLYKVNKPREKTCKAVKRSPEEPVMDEKTPVDQNIPNRKLCFMETLNLTLSPNKKPVRRTSVSCDKPPPVDGENRRAEEDLQINIEEMCLIDEVENHECGGFTEQPPDNFKTSRPGRIPNDVREDRKLSDVAASSVQNRLFNQPLDTPENQMSVHLAPKSSDHSSLKSDSSECDKTTAVSNLQSGEHELSQVTDKSQSVSEHNKNHTPPNIYPGNAPGRSPTEPVVFDSNKTSVPSKVSQEANVEVLVTSDSSECKHGTEEVGVKGSQVPLLQSPQMSQQDLCPPSSTTVTDGKDPCAERDGTRYTDSVSSTTNLDSVPQEGLSLTEAIYVLTKINVETIDSSTAPSRSSPSSGCIGVSKVSSTTEEKTPKKSPGPTKIQGSSSVPLLHDEDSMMHTLNNLKRIPDAISPLRSPVRITKESLVLLKNKPGHVKALQREFSSTTSEPTLKKPDVNKENKYPGCLANSDAQKLVNVVSDGPLSLSETDLEEGEIVSDGEEEASSFQAPATKRAKLTEPVRNKPSPTSALKRSSEETQEAAGVSTHSPRSRFKTVCPAASKACFSTVEEIMETFKLVRTEIRKKYMKLHKTFPKKSFYGVMDNFQKSFLEFVDGAHFGKICCQPEELKAKLKKLIVSVFSKVFNNGIVKRIFEQQAADLKQKLWDFVDIQVDYLFKEINTTLRSFCKAAKALAKNKKPSEGEKEPREAPAEKPQCNPKVQHSHPPSVNQTSPCAVTSYKTGLGSRGKDIRMTYVEKDHANSQNTQSEVAFLPCRNAPQTPEKNPISFVVSQNGSMLDRTDFELLTEQQTSSLTYNLVRDSQMGEIFKCLLQGSDLLESSRVGSDGAAWSLGTPRKDEGRFLSITTPSKLVSPSKLLSPTKFDTPSKLIATWNSISPCKLSRAKEQVPLNPALFDESCLLEVPSENRVLLQASLASQKTYSILAEDLAVSLTLPSPLKSDSHLSFLQPSSLSMQTVSTPDSVISAHISEDALLGEEDAMEQDIHLALDTDNSSSDSSRTAASETPSTPFVFNPDVPMKALVTEKSNDHFIVRIQHVNAGVDTLLTADESLNETLREQDQQHRDEVLPTKQSQDGFTDKHISFCCAPSERNPPNITGNSGIGPADTGSGISVALQDDRNTPHQENGYISAQWNPLEHCVSTECEKNLPKAASSNDGPNNTSLASDHHTVVNDYTDIQTNVREESLPQESPSKVFPSESVIGSSEGTVSSSCLRRTVTNQQSPTSDRDQAGASEFDKSLAVNTRSSPEKLQKNRDNMGKRKKCQEKLKPKRSRKEEEEEEESRLKMTPPKKRSEESNPPPSPLSPNSLSAKNVVRKKGEVVMAWTREEDRAILMNLKTGGASRQTFSALSEKLNKPAEQIAHRFYQLMKLFKKQSMDT